MLLIEDFIINNTESIQEKIYSSNLIIGWHRTKAHNFVQLIKEKGFQPGNGSGSLYGSALYSTYEVESQLNPDMEKYGDYIIKFKIPIKDYLIFDQSIAEKVYGDKSSILDQLSVIEKQKVDSDSFIKKSDPISKLKNISDKTIGIYPEFKKWYNESDSLDFVVDIMTPQEVIACLKKDGNPLEFNIIGINNSQHTSLEAYMLKRMRKYKIDMAEEYFYVIFWIDGHPVSIERVMTSKETTLTNSNFFVTLSILRQNPDYKENEDNYENIYYRAKDVNVKAMIEDIKKMKGETDYSSDWAKKFANRYLGKFNNVKGLIFTGRQDGHVVVSYNYHECIPISIYINGIENKKEKGEKVIERFLKDCIKDLEQQKVMMENAINDAMKENPTVSKEEFLKALDKFNSIMDKDIDIIKNTDTEMFYILSKITFSKSFSKVINLMGNFIFKYIMNPVDLQGMKDATPRGYISDLNEDSPDMKAFEIMKRYILDIDLSKKFHRYQQVDKDILQFFIQRAKTDKR